LTLLFALLPAFALLEVFTRYAVGRWGSPQTRDAIQERRMIAAGEPLRFIPAPYVNYRLAPGYVNVDDGANTRHNRQGFRDISDFGPKADDTLRLVCLGGSTTYGSSVANNRDTYPAALGRLLDDPDDRPAGWKRTEVFNLGVGGYTSAEILANLQFHALPLRPDVVLIQSAINDVAPRFYDNFDRGYTGFRIPMTPVESGFPDRSAFATWIRWRLGLFDRLSLQARTQRPLPPVERALANLEKNDASCFRANLESMIDLARSHESQVWLMTLAYNEDEQLQSPDERARQYEDGYRRGLAEHNQIVREVCLWRGARPIDLDRLMPRKAAYFHDPIHMTAEGNRVKARLIADALRGQLPAGPLREEAPTTEESPKIPFINVTPSTATMAVEEAEATTHSLSDEIESDEND
jgi:lysophospholipase L1-like esterase